MALKDSRYALADGVLLDGDTLTAFSPSKGSWVRPALPVAIFLDSSVIPDSEAKRSMEDSSSLKEPPCKASTV